MDRKKIEYLVADTAAFIQNKALQDLAEHVVTTQRVIDEVKNKRQLKRLAVLPYDLEIKEAFPENVKFVLDISKQTGDYRSLSATDVEVIALTYQLEKEKVGEDHLKKTVEMQKTISFTDHATVDYKDIAGFYLPSDSKSNEEEINIKLQNMSCEGNDNLEEEDSCSDLSDEDPDVITQDSIAPSTNNQIDNEIIAKPDEDLSLPGCLPKLKGCSVNCEDLDNFNPEDILVKVSTEEVEQEANSAGESDEASNDGSENTDSDEDDEGWITPANLKQAKVDMDQLDYEDTYAKVACITTDFAMQNVLKQIGLKVASLDGRIIKQIRTYIFRCYACFKTTNDMTRIFCPNCGHRTLKRVSVTLQPDGTQKIHINIKRPLTSRGRKFQLPVFKGGKHSNNPWVTADQRFPDQKPTRVARTKTDIMDSDYIEGYSPFAVRDTTSRAAVLGIKEQKQLRRPNLYRPRFSKKK